MRSLHGPMGALIATVALLGGCGGSGPASKAPTSTPTPTSTRTQTPTTTATRTATPSPTPALYTGPIQLTFDGWFLCMNIEINGQIEQFIADTGSIYLLYSGSEPLSCTDPHWYWYAQSAIEYCPVEAPFVAEVSPGVTRQISPGSIEYGTGIGVGFPGQGPVIGLAGSLGRGLNPPGMDSVINQLRPRHLSFEFPGGLAKGSIMRFAALPSLTSGATVVPLGDPGNLGYGYTARVARAEFLIDGQVHTTIARNVETFMGAQYVTGMVLESGGTSTPVSADLLAFFDTGTAVPLYPFNADMSLPSVAVTQSGIGTTGPTVDTVVLHFDAEDGGEVTLTVADVKFSVFTPADIPAGIQQLGLVVGLPGLAQYDFQFELLDGVATTATFLEREGR